MFPRLRQAIHRYLDKEVSHTLGLYRHYRNFSFDRFVIAVASVVIVATVRLALSPLLGDDAPFLLFIIAVFVSAWLGGFRTGALAMLLSSAISIVLFVKPSSLVTPEDISALTQLFIFIVVGMLMTILITALTRTKRRSDFVTRKLRKGQQKLDQVHRELKNIVESISDGFVAFDKKWRFTYINQQMEQFFGKRRNVLIGKNIWEMFPGLKKSILYEKCEQAVLENHPSRFEFFSESSGQWYLVNVYPAKEGVSAYFDVITDLKRREEQKDEFVSVASHELKTPVTSVKLFAGILKHRFESKGDSESVELLSRMDHQLDRLSKLIFTLLDVSKIHGGKVEFERKPFFLEKLAEEVIRDISHAHPSHQILLNYSDSIEVLGDKDRIHQVITNLIVNAVKYSPNGKKVIVRVSRRGDEARVSVSDFGPGIPLEKQNKIFDRFFQADDSARQTHSGLGLGLYISKEIILRHHGDIWLESDVGKGTTFYFTLPIAGKK